MRAVIQRVSGASVTVDGEIISKISRGLLVLLGIGTDDIPKDTDYIVNKILNLRLFDDEGTMWKKSVKDIQGEVLCVSQFTLLANTVKGNKPDFHQAMTTELSKAMYSSFLEKLRTVYIPDRIQDGQFGAMMSVALTNEGPVTITVDSRKFEYIDVDGGQGKKGRSTKGTPLAATTPGTSGEVTPIPDP